MQRREFLRNGLLFGSAAMLPGMELSLPVENAAERLFQAIIDGRVDAVEALIRHGVDVNVKGYNNCTALHYATALGNCRITVLKLLVASGADVNAKNDDGTTPLHHASGNGNLESVRFLVEHGADVNIVDEYLLTPLVCAMASENKSVIEYLAGIVCHQV